MSRQSSSATDRHKQRKERQIARRRAKRQERLQKESAGRSPEQTAGWKAGSDEVHHPEQNAGAGRGRKKHRRHMSKLTLGIMIIVALVLFASVRNIVRLQIENRQLKEQKQELQQQRDDLKKELKSVNSKEYIEEKAREQLRLVNPDEIFFVFGEDGASDGDESR